MFGIETDAQWTGQKGSTTVLCPVAGCFPTAVAAGTGVGAALSDKLEWFGTFRGRGGVLVTPSFLLYVTGGLAYGSLQTEVGLSGFTATGIPVTAIGSRSIDKFGWTVGGGIETMFAANWSAKIEYLYMDLGSISNSVVLPTASGFPLGANVTSRVTDSIIRGGISYHFSAGPGPRLRLLIGPARGEAQQAPERCSGVFVCARKAIGNDNGHSRGNERITPIRPPELVASSCSKDRMSF